MACRRCLLLLAAWTPVQMAFQLAVPSAPVTTRGAAITMASAEAVAKKSIVVDAVKEDMEGAMLMFCVRSEGIKVNDINIMRQKFPETTKFRCVKNTLLKRAAQEVPKMQGGDELCKRSNYWFFVPESDVRVSFDIWNDWVQETKNVRAAPSLLWRDWLRDRQQSAAAAARAALRVGERLHWTVGRWSNARGLRMSKGTHTAASAGLSLS